jgi:hypothetical protein
MFPDALRDEDLAPGIHVWNLVGNKSTASLVESPQKDEDSSSNECNTFERTIFKNFENNRASVVLSSVGHEIVIIF